MKLPTRASSAPQAAPNIARATARCPQTGWDVPHIYYPTTSLAAAAALRVVTKSSAYLRHCSHEDPVAPLCTSKTPRESEAPGKSIGRKASTPTANAMSVAVGTAQPLIKPER